MCIADHAAARTDPSPQASRRRKRRALLGLRIALLLDRAAVSCPSVAWSGSQGGPVVRAPFPILCMLLAFDLKLDC